MSSMQETHIQLQGGGYPGGVGGENIPLGSRIIAVADTYDAIISDRPYRKGLSHEAAIKEILLNKGTQFDPLVIDAFVKVSAYQTPADEAFTCPCLDK